MYNFDVKKHHKPHIHTEYQGEEAVYDIENGDEIVGALPRHRKKLVQAWIEIHRDELMADWQLAVTGERVFRIKPLD